MAKMKQDSNYGKLILAKELKQLQKHADGFSVGLKKDDNLYEWQVIVEGPPNTLYEGGYFQAKLSFPDEFPNKPPTMTFTTPGFWHPNVYADGKVCISILHEAKEDIFNPQEKMEEKWRPILSVEAIIISVLSMLSEPNFDSPANIDAAVEWKKNPEKYKKKIRNLVRKSQELMMAAAEENENDNDDNDKDKEKMNNHDHDDYDFGGGDDNDIEQDQDHVENDN